MYCVDIILAEIPEGTPSRFIDSDGLVRFDITPESNVTEVKRELSLDGEGKYNIPSVYDISIPYSDKNHWLCGMMLEPSLLDNTNCAKAYLVTDIYQGRFTNLCVMGEDSFAKRYSLRLSPVTDDNPLVALSKLKLRDLNYEDLEHTKSNFDSINSDHIYNEGDIGVNIPWVNYGIVPRKSIFRLAMSRPLFYTLFLLKKALCWIGYEFRSNAYESQWGRTQIDYLAGNDLWTEEERLNNLSFSWEGTGSSISKCGDLMRWENPNVIIDNGGYWQEFTHNIISAVSIPAPCKYYAYTGEGVFDFNFDGSMIPLDPPGFDEAMVEVSLWKVLGGFIGPNEHEIQLWSESFPAGNIEFLIENIVINKGDRVYFKIKNTEVDVDESGYIEVIGVLYNTPKRAFPIEGEILNLERYIDPDITALDLLKGAAHLIKGKVAHNIYTGEFWLDHPYTVNQFFEEGQLPGFYVEDVIELDVSFIANSKKTTHNYATNRYHRLKFKNSSDAYINDLDLNEEPFSQLIDYGEDYENESEVELSNPFYEPTLQGGFYPIMWDNTDRNLSFLIGPRRLTAHGLFSWWISPNSSSPLHTGGVFAYASCKPELYANVGSGLVIPDYRTVYGEEQWSLYNLFWKRELHELRNQSTSSYGFTLMNYDFYLWDFRKQYSFFDGTFLRVLRAKELSHKYCADEITNIVFKPVTVVDQECLDGGTPLVCENFPTLSYTYDAGTDCFNFTIAGTVNSPLPVYTLEYRVLGTSNWIAVVGNQLCGQTDPFVVRLTVAYGDDCPDSVITLYLGACDEFDFELACDGITTIGGDIYISVSGSTTSGITYTTNLVWSLDGGPTSPYSLGDFLGTVPGIYTVSGQIIPDNGCDPIDVEIDCELVPEPIDCSNVFVGISCIVNSDGTVTSFETSVSGDKIAHMDIWVDDDGDGVFQVWEQGDVLNCPFEYYLSVTFCECGTICTDPQACECADCDPFVLGTPAAFALCN